MEKNTLRVGMRNVKTALAIFVCLLLYQFVPGNASYACIAALIAMQSTLEESWSQGRNRLLGTFIGGIFGAAFASLQIAARLPFWRIVAISAGVTVLIFLLNLITPSESWSRLGSTFRSGRPKIRTAPNRMKRHRNHPKLRTRTAGSPTQRLDAIKKAGCFPILPGISFFHSRDAFSNR